MPTPEIGTELENAAVASAKVTGAVFVAPTSVDLPTDATTPLAADFKLLSYTSSNGVVITEKSTSKKQRVWEGQGLARTLSTERVEQIKLTPVNLNARVAALTWGADAVSVDSTTGAISIGHHGNPVEPCHMVIETVPWTGAVQRRCAKVQLAERGDETLNGEDFQGRELTLDCLTLPDGKTMHEYVAETE